MNQNNVNTNGKFVVCDDKSDVFAFSKEEYDAIKEECMHYQDMRAVSIAALKIVQNSRGWVSDEAVEAVAKILQIAVVDVEGVATFYNQIFRQPVGRHVIRYCDSIVCYLTGYKEIKDTLECTLNIKIGNTTVDNRFTLLPTCCLGMCDKSPVIMINDDMYVRVTSDKIIQVLGSYQ